MWRRSAISRSASSPWTRPKPLCLMPPKGASARPAVREDVVDEHAAGLDALGEAAPVLAVLREHVGVEAEVRLVGEGDGLLLAATFMNGTMGPKISSRITVIEWSQLASTVGSKNCPGPGSRLPPRDELAPPCLTASAMCFSAMSICCGKMMAPTSTKSLRRVALRSSAVSSTTRVDERRVHVVVRVDALDRDADLAGVGEAAEDDGARRALDVGVAARDERRLAAELHHARDEPLAARGRDPLARLDAAGEDAGIWIPASMSAGPVGP